MIIVEQPQLFAKESTSLFSAVFFHARSPKKEELWFEIPVEYTKSLVTDRLDPFVVALLPLALIEGQDLHLKGTVTKRLLYSLNNYLIQALCLANKKYHKIKVIADEECDEQLNEYHCGDTGLSCGVDSFATFYDHLTASPPNRIDYFTFYNVGSHGDFGGEHSREIFHQRLERVKAFATSVGRKVISIGSNLAEILRMNFQSTHTLRNIAVALLFQKLFKTYYYASAYRFDHFKLNSRDTSDSDILYLSLLSTESTNFISGACQYTRVERIEKISQHPETYYSLDVCTNLFHQGEKINCTCCDKCLRTALTLDLIGKLENYEPVFYLNRYYELKDSFIGKVIATRNTIPLHGELYSFMKTKINLNSYPVEVFRYKLLTWKNKKKKRLKQAFNL